MSKYKLKKIINPYIKLLQDDSVEKIYEKDDTILIRIGGIHEHGNSILHSVVKSFSNSYNILNKHDRESFATRMRFSIVNILLNDYENLEAGVYNIISQQGKLFSSVCDEVTDLELNSLNKNLVSKYPFSLFLFKYLFKCLELSVIFIEMVGDNIINSWTIKTSDNFIIIMPINNWYQFELVGEIINNKIQTCFDVNDKIISDLLSIEIE